MKYYAHVEFLNNAQRPTAERLRDLFEGAGWETNFTSLPHDQYSNRYAMGIEVTGPTKHIVESVAKTLNKNGYSPVKTGTVKMDIKKENPKWVIGIRTVRVFIGYPATA